MVRKAYRKDLASSEQKRGTTICDPPLPALPAANENSKKITLRCFG